MLGHHVRRNRLHEIEFVPIPHESPIDSVNIVINSIDSSAIASQSSIDLGRPCLGLSIDGLKESFWRQTT
jgi:hypothetical protein